MVSTLGPACGQLNREKERRVKTDKEAALFNQVRGVVADVDQGSLQVMTDGEVVDLSLRVFLVVLGEQLVLRGDGLFQPGDPRLQVGLGGSVWSRRTLQGKLRQSRAVA